MSNSILFVGDSGDTKTTQLFFLAKWYHKRNPTKKIRLIVAGGGEIEPFETSGIIDEGIVDVFDMSFRKTFLADSRRISEGYWPKGKDKEGQPILKESNEFKTDWKEANIGLYLVDSLSGISSCFLDHLSNQKDGAGFKESWKFEEEEVTIIGLQMGHYGIVQREVHKFVSRGLKKLPIDIIGISALIDKGEDRKKNTVYGPKIAGRRLTEEVPSWFGDNFYLTNELDENSKGEMVNKKVAWCKDHIDPDTNIKCLAKIRLLSEIVPKFWKMFPKGFGPLSYRSGIMDILDAREFLVNEYKKENAKENEKATTGIAV